MISGLLRRGLSGEAYELFRKMAVLGCLPNGCTYNVVIQGFLRNGDASNAGRLMEEMVGRGFSADSSTFQMLSDLESRDEILSLFTSRSSQGRKLKSKCGSEL
ncbi:hypothetical protein OIU76_016701 [Salix suchowensis]|nr:hypothetical protein OIU76_016701 [Salix suchowensis]